MRLDQVTAAYNPAQPPPPKLQDNVIDVKEIKSILYLAINAKALLENASEAEKHAVDTLA